MNSEFLQSSFEKGQYKGTTLAFEHYSTDFEKYLVDEKWLTFDDVWWRLAYFFGSFCCFFLARWTMKNIMEREAYKDVGFNGQN